MFFERAERIKAGYATYIAKQSVNLNVKTSRARSTSALRIFPRSNFHFDVELGEHQLKDNNCTHFPTLKNYNPTYCAQYALECSSFSARFYDSQNKLKLEKLLSDIKYHKSSL